MGAGYAPDLALEAGGANDVIAELAVLVLTLGLRPRRPPSEWVELPRLVASQSTVERLGTPSKGVLARPLTQASPGGEAE